MKKERWTRGILTVLGAALLLTGCGKSSTQEAGGTTSKDYVYQAEEASFTKENGNLYSTFKAGDQVYVWGTDYSKEDQATIQIAAMAEDGSIGEITEITQDSDASLNSLCGDTEGNYYAIRNIYVIPEDDNEAAQDLYELISLDAKGVERFAVSLNEEAALNADPEAYFYINNMVLTGDKLVLAAQSGLAIYDLSGNPQKVIPYSEIDQENEVSSANLLCLSDGKVLLSNYAETGLLFYTFDPASGSFSKAYTCPGQSYNYSFVSGIGYDLYLIDSTGVSGYQLGDTETTMLMNYVDSDINTYSIYNVTALSETSFLGFIDDEETGTSVATIFTKVNPEDVPDKETITLAYNYADWDVRSAAVKFNKSNTKYRIKIVDYSSLYNTDGNYSAGLTQLNADIVSGKMPDILVVDSAMPIESYVGKGLFEDLKPYIEADEELDLNNFMPNIIDLCSTDGALYFLVPSYSISTIVGKTEDVGSEPGWTLQDAEALLDSKPEGTVLFYETTSDTIMNNALTMASDQFIDWETGSCSFNGQSFVDLLNFAVTFPTANEDGGDAQEEYTDNYDSLWREGKVLLSQVYLGAFSDYNNAKKGTFDSDITCVGFPAGSGKGSVINYRMQLAMSSKSKEKEGVWEFIRYFLTDEYQEKLTYNFPLSIKRLDELGEEAKEDPYYLDENQNKVFYKNTMYLNGIEVPIDPMTDDEVAEVKEILYSMDNATSYKESVMNIIQEESAPFFAGQKTAQEVADIIQSRMQVYVDENR